MKKPSVNAVLSIIELVMLIIRIFKKDQDTQTPKEQPK